MDNLKIGEWSLAVDTAEMSPISSRLPQAVNAGDVWDEEGPDGVRRKWLGVRVISGTTGGRWIYWAAWKEPKVYPERNGIGPNPDFLGIADRIFNGDAPHFVGMLAVPYVKTPSLRTPGPQEDTDMAPVYWV